MLIEPLIKIFGGDDLVFSRILLVVDIRDFDSHRGLALLQRDLSLVVVLRLEVLKRNVSYRRIVLLIFEGSVCDERRNVLLDLSKVLNNIVLREGDAVFIVLLLGDAEVELALFEHVDHCSNELLDLSKHFFGLGGFSLTKKG